MRAEHHAREKTGISLVPFFSKKFSEIVNASKLVHSDFERWLWKNNGK